MVKNASLGEMISNMTKFGINIPYGFAITTEAYDKFLNDNHLNEYIANQLEKIRWRL